MTQGVTIFYPHTCVIDSMVEIGPVEKLVEKQHPTAQIFIYEAGHGFNSDRRKDYHPASAELAKERTLMLFRALLAPATVERTEHILAGARRCAYRVTA